MNFISCRLSIVIMFNCFKWWSAIFHYNANFSHSLILIFILFCFFLLLLFCGQVFNIFPLSPFEIVSYSFFSLMMHKTFSSSARSVPCAMPLLFSLFLLVMLLLWWLMLGIVLIVGVAVSCLGPNRHMRKELLRLTGYETKTFKILNKTREPREPTLFCERIRIFHNIECITWIKFGFFFHCQFEFVLVFLPIFSCFLVGSFGWWWHHRIDSCLVPENVVHRHTWIKRMENSSLQSYSALCTMFRQCVF